MPLFIQNYIPKALIIFFKLVNMKHLNVVQTEALNTHTHWAPMERSSTVLDLNSILRLWDTPVISNHLITFGRQTCVHARVRAHTHTHTHTHTSTIWARNLSDKLPKLSHLS